MPACGLPSNVLIGIAATGQYYGDEAKAHSSNYAPISPSDCHRPKTVFDLCRPLERLNGARQQRGRLSTYRAKRAADLVVTGAQRNGFMTDLAGNLDSGDLVMQVGRPILVVPPLVQSLKLKLAMVCWKDTREARRAVSDASPLLRSPLCSLLAH
jgi:hypothetical protein